MKHVESLNADTEQILLTERKIPRKTENHHCNTIAISLYRQDPWGNSKISAKSLQKTGILT